MENPCDFVIRLSDMHKISHTRKIGLLNFSERETIKSKYFWQTCIGPESNPKNICFYDKKLFGKRFEKRNNKCCNAFNTHKNGRLSDSPIPKNKHWIYCLKTIKSEEFQDPPPPFCVDFINGWPLNSSWLWKANIWNNNHIHLFNILIFCGKMENHKTGIHEKLSYVFLKINEPQKQEVHNCGFWH